MRETGPAPGGDDDLGGASFEPEGPPDPGTRTVDLDDATLISRTRAGDSVAWGELFSRHHSAAKRLAYALTRSEADADDLASDAFIKVHAAVERGGGPGTAFRAYLLTTVRRLFYDRATAAARQVPTDDVARLDTSVPFRDPAHAEWEMGAARRAFQSLPERWQVVLLHMDVEGDSPRVVAKILGITPNAVSALAYRAREGLRTAYVQQHVSTAAVDRRPDC